MWTHNDAKTLNNSKLVIATFTPTSSEPYNLHSPHPTRGVYVLLNSLSVDN